MLNVFPTLSVVLDAKTGKVIAFTATLQTDTNLFWCQALTLKGAKDAIELALSGWPAESYPPGATFEDTFRMACAVQPVVGA